MQFRQIVVIERFNAESTVVRYVSAPHRVRFEPLSRFESFHQIGGAEALQPHELQFASKVATTLSLAYASYLVKIEHDAKACTEYYGTLI